jgi:hypothetical protein
MDRTWKPKAAGILCITVGAIWVVSGLVLPIALCWAPSCMWYAFMWFGAPLIIPGIMLVLGGIYALRRRKWGLALAGSILTLFGSVILGRYGIIIFLGATVDNPSVKPGDLTSLITFFIVGVAIFGILGLLGLIFIILGRREFEQSSRFNR